MRTKHLLQVILASVLSLFMLAAVAESGPKEAMGQFVDAFNKQDAAGVTALFHEDGKLLPAGKPMITGTEAIQAYWQGSFDAGLSGIKKTSIEYVVSEDLAVETSSYVITFKEMEILGKDTLVWRRGDDGEWKISTDIWASDQ
jgi:ketosteroid isomerase-like protein